jgi:hypothetical protein
MNRIIQIKNFNGLLDQFFDFLDESFPEFRSDFILGRSTMELVRRSNPRLVVEQFMDNIRPYRKYIFECDEDFFTSDDTLSRSNLSKDDMLLGMKLKQIWLSNKITTKQKALVFYYFQKLILSAEAV